MIRIISPSDLSYLYDRCPRCYWLKLRGIKGPSDVLPQVFRDIDRAQKAGISLDAIRALGIPAVDFIPKDKTMSKQGDYSGSTLVVSGMTDKRVRLEDGTVGVLDFKTSTPRIDRLARYWRAMSAYQYAIENPAEGQGQEVTLLALLTFSPTEFRLRPEQPRQAYFMGTMLRHDLDIDRAKFDRQLHQVGKLLATTTMPEAGACDVCRHADHVAAQRVNVLLDQITHHPNLGPEMAALIAANLKP